MMDNNAKFDDELAALTDKLLAGEDTEVSPEIEDLAAVIKNLHQVIDPDQPADPAFRQQLRQRLDFEWTQQARRSRSMSTWSHKRRTQITAIAAALVVIIGVVFVLMADSTNDSAQIEGTALDGSISLVVVVIGAVIIAGILTGWYFWRKK